MRAADVDGDDGLLRSDGTCPMCHGDGEDCKALDGFMRQPLEHRRQPVLPSIEFQP